MNSSHNPKRWQWAFVIGASAVLAACSDGGGYDAPAPPPPPPPAATGDVPASAQASPSAWTSFVGGQAKSETAKPLDLTGVVAPFSETAPPQPI